jgi:hypothetical protein
MSKKPGINFAVVYEVTFSILVLYESPYAVIMTEDCRYSLVQDRVLAIKITARQYTYQF